MNERSSVERVPTIRCPSCGSEYAAECPACPYCNWVPLRTGRAPWQRKVFIAAGFVISVLAGVQVEHGWLIALAGISGTTVLANYLIGGGDDV